MHAQPNGPVGRVFNQVIVGAAANEFRVRQEGAGWASAWVMVEREDGWERWAQELVRIDLKPCATAFGDPFAHRPDLLVHDVAHGVTD